VYITGDVTPEYLDRVEAARNEPEAAGEEPGQRAQMNLQFSVANDSR
jgi:amidophosphoribosyltransferase